MKTIILFCCFTASALAVPFLEQPLHNPTYFLYEASPGIYVKEDLTIKSGYQAEVSDVVIYFYSRSIDGVQVNLSDLSTLSNTDYSAAKPTIFTVHGWRNNHSSLDNTAIRTAYLLVQDANVFVVDWGKVANQLYVIAQWNVQSVGEILGQLINNLVSGAGLSLVNTTLVGHSLGAHVAGVAGKYIGGAANQVVGLDPAGPLFFLNKTDNRITNESGSFVEIIHTNAGLLGMNAQLGDADYRPNGGHTQPGCILDVTGSCAHGRSFLYYSESLISGNFITKSCADWTTYENGNCANNPTAYMGEISVDRTASGNYFLDTNDESPYAKG